MKLKIDLNKPVHQAISAFIVFIIGLIAIIPFKSNLPEILENEISYVIHAIIILLFAFINAISIFNSDNEKAYWTQSLYSFILLLIFGIMISTFVTGLGVKETKSFSLIYPLISGCYLIIFIITTLIKKILIYANQQP